MNKSAKFSLHTQSIKQSLYIYIYISDVIYCKSELWNCGRGATIYGIVIPTAARCILIVFLDTCVNCVIYKCV